MNDDRNLFMDNLKGFLIWLVVFAHFIIDYVEAGVVSLPIESVFYFIYSFHMPLFVFISGFFSKNLDKVRETSFARLLVPFFIFNSCMLVYCAWAQGQLFNPFSPAYVNWYLLALFYWRLFAKDLVKLKWVVCWSLVVALFAGFSSQVNNFLAISRAIGFLPFFLMGYFTSESRLTRIRKINKPLAFSGLVLSGCAVYYMTSRELLSTDIFVLAPYATPWEIVLRVAFFVLASTIGVSCLVLCPNYRVPLLTFAGANTLLIFVLHRYVTLVSAAIMPPTVWSDWFVGPFVIATSVTVYLLGQPVLTSCYQRILQAIIRSITATEGTAFMSSITRRTLIVAFGILNVLFFVWFVRDSSRNPETVEAQPAVLTKELKARIDESVSICFVGDMILLEDQVKHGWHADFQRYDFAPVFAHVDQYLRAADYTIGVLEVPLAGAQVGYSRGNFDDGVPLALNGPDEWALEIKHAGVDLVSLANNHILDKGRQGLIRTLDTLDRIGLDHVGGYRNAAERETPFVVDIKGLRVAFLAYTYGVNQVDEFAEVSTATDCVSTLAPPQTWRSFQKTQARLNEDVKRARQSKPDLIVALPHMGTQFAHDADPVTRRWAEIMFHAGVDVILAAHSHAVQPIEELVETDATGNMRRGLVVYCPGNFVNQYVEHDGDAAAMVHVHVSLPDGDRPRVVSASIIPMWIHRPLDGQFKPLPVFDAVTDPTIRSVLSQHEWQRIREVQELVTRVMLGTTVTLDQLQPRYYFVPGKGYVRQLSRIAPLTDRQNESLDPHRRTMLRLLRSGKRTVVIGDSISAGSKNGGYPWFEPLMAAFPNTEFVNRSVGGATTKTVLNTLDKILEEAGDVFIVAIGTNDVRYRRQQICAMTADEYVQNMSLIRKKILSRNPNASIIFVNPWIAFDNDIHSVASPELRDELLKEYGTALRDYAIKSGDIYLNANAHIRDFLRTRARREYVVDHIHPNAGPGIILYSNAVLFGPPAEWRLHSAEIPRSE